MSRESWKTLPPGPGDIPPVIAKAVKAYRQGAGLSQGALGERMADLGFAWSRATAAKVETGVRRIDVPELVGIAVIVGVPLIDLLVPPFAHWDYAESGVSPDDLRKVVSGAEGWPEAAHAIHDAWEGN